MSNRASVKPVASFLFAAMLACPVAVLAQTSGGGGGGGGGAAAPDYGDLVVLDRDEHGVPVLSPATQLPDPEDPLLLVDAGLCLQPIAAAGVTFDPCTLNSTGEFCLIPLDQITCSVLPEYAIYTQEVEFERINVARAPADVMARQLEDALINLATADCLSLDPAGRLVYQKLDINDSDGDGDFDEYLSSDIDSPLQNLAIYKEMILKGQLGDPAINLPKPWANYGFLDTAAKGLGAASSKEGSVNVDEVVYLNQILGLADATTTTVLDPKICIQYRDEVKGKMVLVDKCFLDYSDYNYRRAKTYRLLPFPAYIPEEAPLAGWFEYLAKYKKTQPNGDPLFFIRDARILPTVWPNTETPENDFLLGFVDGDIGGIAQAADDARAVILFLHNNPIPAGYETPPLVCSGDHQTAYDVSIDADTGLAVPTNMVANEDGREVTVTVGNSGPDKATGSVTVVGTGAADVNVTFDFTDLAAGTTQSWVFQVVATSTGTIEWTATVTAAYDVYAPNNTATATTTVNAGGSGGSGE